MTNDNTIIDYQLTRSNRKTIEIRIKPNQNIEIIAPKRMSMKSIDEFVCLKKNWVHKHLQIMSDQSENTYKYFIDYGDDVIYRGKKYPIIESLSKKVYFDGESFNVPKGLDMKDIKQEIIKEYKNLALKVMTEKTLFFSSLTNLIPKDIKVSCAKTRWGSCSGKNSINFSWRLILADDDIIDYVVIHELAHIKEHNHSKHFWLIVEKFLPYYYLRRQKLKEFQKTIYTQKWLDS